MASKFPRTFFWCAALATIACWQMTGSEASADASDLPEGWLTDFDAALAQGEAEGKEILAVFSTSWCAPCQQMVQNTYPDPTVIEALADWVKVYVDGDAHRDIAMRYSVSGFPSFVFFDSSGEMVGKASGARGPEGFIAMLETRGDPPPVVIGPGGPAETFDVADADVDGGVSADEFGSYIADRLGEVPFIDEFFAAVDADGDGALNEEEFAKRFEALRSIASDL